MTWAVALRWTAIAVGVPLLVFRRTWRESTLVGATYRIWTLVVVAIGVVSSLARVLGVSAGARFWLTAGVAIAGIVVGKVQTKRARADLYAGAPARSDGTGWKASG